MVEINCNFRQNLEIYFILWTLDGNIFYRCKILLKLCRPMLTLWNKFKCSTKNNKYHILVLRFYLVFKCWCIYRSMRGPDSIPAAKPQDCNSYVKAVLYRLCAAYPGRHKRDGQVWSRWSLILDAYSNIRTTLLNSVPVMEKTNLQFPEISQKTLKAWYGHK